MNKTAEQEARNEIAAGRAKAHALWVILSDEHERDGFWLKPLTWEGPGEYQRVRFDDGREGFVRISTWRSLPVGAPWSKARA